MTASPNRVSLTRISRSLLFVSAAVPILVVPGIFFPYVTTRNIVFRICVEVSLLLVLLAWVRRSTVIKLGADPILKWFLAFIGAIVLSAVMGASVWHSIFGDFERMGGVWAWSHLLLFYALLGILMDGPGWARLFRAMVLIADFVTFWGATEFLPSATRNPHFEMPLSAGSTVGNPGLLAPYLLLSLVLCCLLLRWEKKPAWRIIAAVSIPILLIGLAGSQNRSSQLGLVVGTITGLVCFYLFHSERKRLTRAYAVTGILAIVLLFAGSLTLTRYSPPLVNTLGGKWQRLYKSPGDPSRTIEWAIAAKGFEERPILGYGPENHQVIASEHFDPAIYAVAGNGVYDRTHNAWLELLATTGLIGTIAMLGLWASAILTVRSGLHRQKIDAGEAAIVLGAMAAYAVYLAFWFFDINSAFIWVALLAWLSSRVHSDGVAIAQALEPQPVRRQTRMIVWASVAVLALTIYLHGVVPFLTARDLNTAVSGGPFEVRLAAYNRVMNSSAPQTFHTFPLYYRFLRSSSGLFPAARSNPVLGREFDLAFRRGMIEGKRSIARNPLDDRVYVDDGRFRLLAGIFYLDTGYVRSAQRELLRAARMSPRRPDARLLAANVYLTLHDTTSAIAQIDSAITYAPTFGLSYFYRGQIALSRGETVYAARMLTTATDREYAGPARLYSLTMDTLALRGDPLGAARLGEKYVEVGNGPIRSWRGGGPKKTVLSPEVEAIAERLPALLLAAGDSGRALMTARVLVSVASSTRSEMTKFIGALRR